MTNPALIKDVLTSIYEARVRGDVEGTLAGFDENAVFEINGRGVGAASLSTPLRGKAAIRAALQDLIDNFQFSDWRSLAILVDGDGAALHWRGKVTYRPNGKSADLEFSDIFAFKNGKIISFHQSTDTAMLQQLVAA